MAESLKEIFKYEVCSTCGYCKDDLTEPEFCMIVYSGDKERFLSIVQYLLQMRRHDRKKFKDMYNSFEGFCGLWCNSKPLCPNKSNNCKNIATVLNCFTAFVEQNNADVTDEIKSSIYKTYSGIEMDKIGLRYKLSNTAKKDIKKKMKSLKKKIFSLTGECFVAIKGAVADAICKKEVSTSFFFRENPKWVLEIETILGEKITVDDKTRNEDRQSAVAG